MFGSTPQANICFLFIWEFFLSLWILEYLVTILTCVLCGTLGYCLSHPDLSGQEWSKSKAINDQLA